MTDLTLGGRTFALRPFTLRENMGAYPLAQKLSTDGLLDRWVAAKGLLVVSGDQMADLAELAFLACKAAEPGLTRDEFDQLPITPPELLDAFLEGRYCTGAWIKPVPGAAPPPGEGEGVAEPPASTSAGSPQD